MKLSNWKSKFDPLTHSESYRLPKNENGEYAHIPQEYKVNLWSHGLKKQDMNEGGYFEVSGTVEIKVKINKDSRYMVLHSAGTEGSHVTKVKVKDETEYSITTLI